MSHPIEHKAQNEAEATSEMMPFLIYAAIPILLTIAIAFYFGTTSQINPLPFN
jgi:hypothetical protein